MRIFRTEIWSYAVLLIVLFCIASVAVWYTLTFIEEHVASAEFRTITAAMWSLTMGFMLIAGSFGLWAIQFAGEKEGRRRIGRLIDAMDYLRDGIIVTDRKGRISGSNPAARSMCSSDLDKKESILAVLPCLDQRDSDNLLLSESPSEVEKDIILPEGKRTWRVRSQPTEDMVLLMLSDVSKTNDQRLRSRQAARLQLIGEIARGVAHDFNNLLCGISGYASIISRSQQEGTEANDCARAINRSVERGIAMAGHLLTLSQEGVGGRFTDKVSDHIEAAAAVIRDSLPEGWKLETRTHGRIPTVALTGTQVEQLVTNLGFLAADAVNAPSVLRIEAGGAEMPGILRTDSVLAGVIVVGVVPDGFSLNDFKPTNEQRPEYGVIESVLKSMLQESGGNLETVVDGRGHTLFRVALPLGNMLSGISRKDELPEELKAYVGQWKVVLATPKKAFISLERSMDQLHMEYITCDSIAAMLAAIERTEGIDAIVVDSRILTNEGKGVLRAVLKLSPSSAVTVLCEDPTVMPEDLAPDVVFLEYDATPDAVIGSMIEAKSLASKRR